MAKKRDYPDHVRALTLLWRADDVPSARSGLTVGAIAAAAIDIADGSGLAALSMRQVAQRLEVGAMSLYTYVPGKDELMLLMVDTVLGELPHGERGRVSWRARLEAIARDRRDLYRQHPWLIDVPLSRPVVGPNGADRYEYELSAVEGIGLDDLEMNAVIEVIQGHAAGTARRAVAIARDAHRSGLTDDEWWYSVLPTMTRVMSDRFYPLAERVGSAVGAPHTEPDHVFEFGLARILDGVDALIATRTAE